MELDWLYKYFDLITPYMVGRVPYEILDDEKFKESSLSLPAYSFSTLLNTQHYSISEGIKGLSNETLTNILTERYEENEKVVPTERDELLDAVGDVTNNEIEGGNIHPIDYPIWNLVSGILHDGNWEYLSDTDLLRWAACYGFKPKDEAPMEQTRKEATKVVIVQQNAMLREMDLFAPGDFSIRGIDIVIELIQSKYDPDYTAPVVFHNMFQTPPTAYLTPEIAQFTRPISPP